MYVDFAGAGVVVVWDGVVFGECFGIGGGKKHETEPLRHSYIIQ